MAIKRKASVRYRRTPSQVLLAAYRAANRGRDADANRLVLPSVVKSIDTSIAGLRRLNLSLRRSPDPRLRSAAWKPRLFTDRHLCWKAVTYGRSLVSVDATREVVSGSRATVFLRLELPAGQIVRTKQTLIRKRGTW